MSHPSESLRASESWAEVRAHDQVVRYRRSGSGRSVVVLCPDDAITTLWPELMTALDRDFRVLVPTMPSAKGVVRSLIGFLDGLGTPRVAIVATDALCATALELALLDTERVARMVLLPCERDERDTPRARIANDLPVPVLIVPRSTDGASAVSRIGAFLCDAWG